MGNLTLFEALTGGAFDRLNWQHSGEFDQNFSKKSNARGFARGGMGGFGIDRYISNRSGARFSKLPVITGPVKLFCFPLRVGVSKVLKMAQ